jgi:allantoin racemase
MRILLANSNTSAEVTRHVKSAAEQAAAPGTEIVACNARFGPRVVASRADAAISQHALLDLVAAHAEGCDAVVLAMSLDAGLWAAREMLEVPVIGMSEAALALASTMGNRLVLLTFGRGSPQPYREMVEAYGHAARVALVQSLGVTPEECLARPEAADAAVTLRVEETVRAAEVDAVILVGAVAAGMPKRLQARVPVPLVEGISAGVLLAEARVRLGHVRPQSGSFKAAGRRPATGLSAALAARLYQDG